MNNLIPEFKKILLIEEGELDRTMVRGLLNQINANIVIKEAFTSQSGIELYLNETFDCVLLDNILPDQNGLVTLQKLLNATNIHDNEQTVFIVLTGENDEKLAIELMEAGATDYLDKNNLNADLLIRSLRYAVARLQYQKETSKRVQSLLEQQRYIATHDALTGLSNRLLLAESANLALSQSVRQKSSLALLFMDLDGFKQINDTLGHKYGDELLIKISKILKELIRETDILSRLGGDEFVIILTNIKNSEDAATVANSILRRLDTSFILQNQEHYISASIGISIAPEDGTDFETLLKHSDLTMYTAKAKGKNNYQFFNPSLNAKAEEKLNIIRDLRYAIDNNEFEVYLQPQVDTQTFNITGAEALIRWQHPVKGYIEPAVFISIAEESGFINSVGEYMMRRVLQYLEKFPWPDDNDFYIAVNISVEQFNKSQFVEQLCKLVHEFNLPASCIELEITESIFIHNYNHVVSLLHHLKAIGFRICMDDFGTGYSCLNYLRQLPLDGLKVDRSFITHVASNHKDREIIRAIISLAHHLNIRVIAEGVETREQLDFLIGEGCEMLQGYFFSRPVPANQFLTIYQQGFKNKNKTE